MRTSIKMLLAITVLAAAAVYFVGPRLLAPQSDAASSACSTKFPDDNGQTRWAAVPLAGWRCVTSNGDHYLGWWA